MIVTMTMTLHIYVIGFAYHFTRLTFDQSLIKLFQIVQESWKGQERVMDRWVDKIFDTITYEPRHVISNNVAF